MKVFNWVHRRFLNVHSCKAFLQDNGELEDGSSQIKSGKHGYLEHDAHVVVDLLDHWKDGILAIGTIAISPLEACEYGIIDDDHETHDDQEITNVHGHGVMDDEDGDDINDYDEASPLMNVEFFSHELEKVIGANHEITEEEIAENVIVDDLKDKYGYFTEDEGQTKRRVTLADLFMEDPDYFHPVKVLEELDDDDDDDGANKDEIMTEKQGLKMIMKPTSRVKNRLSKAKKLVMEEMHPLKKFNKLMKRMMKKKIHPDLEGKTKKDKQIQPSYNPTNDQDAANHELASLLLIQDDMI